MSKMIRVESCGGCDKIDGINISGRASHFCMLLIKIANEQSIVADPSKILPNCPLEDYPENADLEKAADIIKRLTTVNPPVKWGMKENYNDIALEDAEEFLLNFKAIEGDG